MAATNPGAGPGYTRKTYKPGAGNKGKPNGAAAPSSRFKLIHIDDVDISTEPLFLVADLIPAGPALGVIFGKPKSGKSFLIADMFYSVAMGRPYCGCDVQQGAVVYITSEGVRGFQRRMVAMRRKYGVENVPFYLVHTMPKLGDQPGDAADLILKIREAVPAGMPIAAVIIDTLARAMTGHNDSSSEDVSVVVDNCDTIASELSCFVGILHHSPRGDDTRGRGSNVLDGAVDCLISVVKDKVAGISTATIEDLKDGDAGMSWRFRIEEILVDPRNQNGAVAGGCATVSNPKRGTESATERNQKLSPMSRRFLDLLAEAILDHGATVPASGLVPFGIKAVTRERLRKCLVERGFLDSEKPASARAMMSKYINELAGRYKIGTDATYVWLPKP